MKHRDVSIRDVALEKRGNTEMYYVSLSPSVGISIISVAYPRLVEIFGLRGASRVLRRMFRMIAGYCVGPALEELVVGSGEHPGHMDGLEAEHPIDRQVMKFFLKTASSGTLTSGKTSANLPAAIAPQWFKDNWNTGFSALAARPRIGSATGISPDSPNDRVMESLGSYDYPDPFVPTDKQVNGAKGAIMQLHQPATPNRVSRLAEEAVRLDSQGHLDDLLSAIRAGIAVFEYLNRQDVVERFNMVRRQVRLQLTYIEADVPGARGIAQWWDVFTQDYFDLVGERARIWARNVIQAAAEPFQQALHAGAPLAIGNQALGALEQMLDEIDNMVIPGDNSMPNFPPPGGGGGSA
jgi:chitinase